MGCAGERTVKHGRKSRTGVIKALFGKMANKANTKKPPSIPERIQKDQPKPELKPSGSLKAQAAQVDRTVREKRDAEIAGNRAAGNSAHTRSKPVRLKRHFNRGKDQDTDRGR